MDIVKKIINDKDFEKKAVFDLKTELDKEISKSFKNRDFDKINELTNCIHELTDGEIHSDNINKEKIYQKINNFEKSAPVRHKIHMLMPLLIAAVIALTANCVSVAAWDMNIVSAVIEFTKGGMSIDFLQPEKPIVSLPITEDDPYGMITECIKYDVYPQTPHYLPDGFKLNYVENNVNKTYANSVHFVFSKGRQNISIEYSRYWNDVGQIGIPSDEHNISETDINGNPAIVSKEDNQYVVAFQNEKTVCIIFAQDIDYNECDKIIASIH